MNSSKVSNSRSARGFSLIELMISVTIGLIVAAGAVKLIVAIDQANSETIQSTRLTQELRSLAAVIAADIKRAQRLHDPIAAVAQGLTADCPLAPKAPDNQPCYLFATAQTAAINPDTSITTPKCFTYGYTGRQANRFLADGSDNPNYDTYARSYVYHAVRLKTGASSTVGTVVLDEFTFDPSDPTIVAAKTALPTQACPMNPPAGAGETLSSPIQLNSDEVNITSLCFSVTSDAKSCYFNAATSKCELNSTVAIAPAGNEVDICIAGKLIAGDTYMKTITRGFVQPVFVRSTRIN